MNINELRKNVKGIFATADLDQIDVPCAVVHANRQQNVPVWLCTLAPPSNLKTEIARAILVTKDSYEIEELTIKTLMSGAVGTGGTVNALLPRLTNDKKTLLVTLDFGIVLTMTPDERRKILQELRQVYDGVLTKDVGNLNYQLKWKGHLGYLTCATPALDRIHETMEQLGNRFIFMRPRSASRLAIAKQARLNQLGIKEKRKWMKEWFAEFLGQPVRSHEDIEVPEAIGDRMDNLACVASALRSSVYRNPYRYEEIDASDGQEGPGRLQGQLMGLLRSLAAIRGRGRVTDADFETVRRVALDSVLPQNLLVLRAVVEGAATVTEVSRRLLISASTVRRRLEDYEFLRVLVRHQRDERGTWAYRVDEELLEQIEAIGGFAGSVAEARRALQEWRS